MAAALVVAAVSGSPARAQRQAERDQSALLVDAGREEVASGNYKKAAELLDRALELNPRRVEAYVLRAAVHAARQQYAEGIALLRKARDLAPDNPDVLTPLGALLVASGNGAEGIPLLEAVIAKWPERFDAHAVLGPHYAARGDHARAVAAFRGYLESRPPALRDGDPGFRVQLGDSLLRTGDARAAEEEFAAALAARPDHRRAQVGQAWAVAALDCARAVPLLDRVRDLAADHPEIRLVRGRCALVEGDASLAIRIADTYLRQRPNEAGGLALRGEANARLERWAEARRDLGAALERDPDAGRYAVRLAVAERNAGAPARAIELLRGPGASERETVDWGLEMGRALLATGDRAEAVRVGTELATRYPDDARAHLALGESKLAADDVVGAIVSLERAHKLDPDDAHGRALLIRALNTEGVAALHAKDVERAGNRLARAVEVGGGGTTWRNLGIAQLAAGRNPDAVKSLTRAADTGDGPARLLLARAHAEAGRIDDARAALASVERGAVDPAEVALERANIELRAGEPAAAIDALETALSTKPSAEMRARLEPALATVSHAAATRDLQRGRNRTALNRLERAAALVPADSAQGVAISCDLALAAAAAGDRKAALSRLRRLVAQKTACPYPAPADRLIAPILLAFVEGQGDRGRRAIATLERMRSRATGAAEPLWRSALRSLLVIAAVAEHEADRTTRAAALLRKARALDRKPSIEILHDLAVVDLEGGRVDAAVAVFERAVNDIPEALINLGIAADQSGDHAKALEMYRRAAKRGVSFEPLAEWIESKERIYGGAP